MSRLRSKRLIGGRWAQLQKRGRTGRRRNVKPEVERVARIGLRRSLGLGWGGQPNM